jgi:hypothetical protein
MTTDDASAAIDTAAELWAEWRMPSGVSTARLTLS